MKYFLRFNNFSSTAVKIWFIYDLGYWRKSQKKNADPLQIIYSLPRVPHGRYLLFVLFLLFVFVIFCTLPSQHFQHILSTKTLVTDEYRREKTKTMVKTSNLPSARLPFGKKIFECLRPED